VMEVDARLMQYNLLRQETTDLLNQWSKGCPDAWSRVLDRVYPDLKRLGKHRACHLESAVEPSDIVQELYLRLERQQGVDWANRTHFFAVAARLIRRVLVDQIRFGEREKRGSRAEHVGLRDLEIADDGDPEGLLALHEALDRLALESPSAAKVVELRYFAGLTLEETADVLGLARRTVLRRWRFARAWLFTVLRDRESS